METANRRIRVGGSLSEAGGLGLGHRRGWRGWRRWRRWRRLVADGREMQNPPVLSGPATSFARPCRRPIRHSRRRDGQAGWTARRAVHPANDDNVEDFNERRRVHTRWGSAEAWSLWTLRPACGQRTPIHHAAFLPAAVAAHKVRLALHAPPLLKI